MELVVDTNVVVAGFLRSAKTRELLLDERLLLWAPEYLLTETERVLLTPRLRRHLGSLSPQDVRVLLAQLTARIRILPTSAFHPKLPEAKTVVADSGGCTVHCPRPPPSSPAVVERRAAPGATRRAYLYD